MFSIFLMWRNTLKFKYERSFFLDPLKMLYKFRKLIVKGTRNELKQKYAGSLLGVFWMFLYPFLLFIVYALMYLVIFRVRPMHMTPGMYVIYLLSGLIPFVSFSEGLNGGAVSLTSKKSLLLNTVYPSALIPLQTVLFSHISSVVGFFILIIADLIVGGLNPDVIFVPFILILQVMFLTGLVWFLAIFNLILSDIQQFLPIVTIFLMILSPIAYTPAMVPGSLKIIIWLNPFSYYVRLFQDFFVYGHVQYSLLIIACIISFSFFFGGFWFYNKVKAVFYDYV